MTVKTIFHPKRLLCRAYLQPDAVFPSFPMQQTDGWTENESFWEELNEPQLITSNKLHPALNQLEMGVEEEEQGT